MRNFIKKYWLIIAIVFAAVLYLVNLFIKSPGTTVAPTSTPQRASYNNLIPGISSEAELIKALGTPIRTNINGSIKTDEFKSTSELRHHIATIQNDKIIFFKEIVSANDKTTANDLINIYGVAPDVLYSKFTNATFDLYIYPSNGIAYLGHREGTLLEIWYFEPTTIEKFITDWGQDYSTVQPSEQLQ